MVLELDRGLVLDLPEVADDVTADPLGAAWEFDVVLDQDAVLNDGEGRLSRDFAILVEQRAMVDDVERLPFAGFAAGVHQRHGPAVESAALAVGIGLIVVGIEHLDLELALKEDAAVAATLAGAGHGGRRGELDVQLARPERLFGLNEAGARTDSI